MIPIICDDKGTSILSGPLKNINCLNHKTRGDLYAMVETIGNNLGIDNMPTNSFLDEVENILNFKALTINKSNIERTEKAIATIDQEEKSNNLFDESDIPNEIKEAIKTIAKTKWKDDFEMVVDTIKDQYAAYLEYKNFTAPDIDENELKRIIRNAEIKWSNDYEMIIHTIKEQVENRRQLDNL